MYDHELSVAGDYAVFLILVSSVYADKDPSEWVKFAVMVLFYLWCYFPMEMLWSS